MTATNEQQLSHTDRHDLDKLARWKAGLDAAPEDAAPENGAKIFPACAIFLVSLEDRASHDIFRAYRSAFEDLGGGFHHLVIFGQHGVSTTQAAFLAEVGMEPENVPLLVIAPMAEGASATGSVYCLELPKGDRDGELDDSQNWGAALNAVRAAASAGGQLALHGIAGVRTQSLRHGRLTAAVDAVVEELNGGR